MTADPSAIYCTNLAAALKHRIDAGEIQWIKTNIDLPDSQVFIAVENVNENSNIYRVLMDHDYYAEYHFHRPLRRIPKQADKIRIKKKPRQGINLITTDPARIDVINDASCNLWNGIDTLSGIHGTQDQNLITAAFNSKLFFTTFAEYKTWSDKQRASQAKKKEPTAEEIEAHHRQQDLNQKMDSFSRTSGYDYSDIIENNWNHGYVYSQYDQYSDHLKSAKTIDYDSTLLGVCGVITLVLLCLVCFIGALICGYFVGKIVRQIKDSECTPFQIGTENE
eukprot:91073_1